MYVKRAIRKAGRGGGEKIRENNERENNVTVEKIVTPGQDLNITVV